MINAESGKALKPGTSDKRLKGFEEMKAQLMETAAENDEFLLDKYFETGDLTREETIRGIRIGIASVQDIQGRDGTRLFRLPLLAQARARRGAPER